MRDEKGQFADGNPGGPGRPPRDADIGYLCAMADACDLDTWKEIVARAVTDAKGGNAKARDWLSVYLLGKPSTDAVCLGKIGQAEFERSLAMF